MRRLEPVLFYLVALVALAVLVFIAAVILGVVPMSRTLTNWLMLVASN